VIIYTDKVIIQKVDLQDRDTGLRV